MRYFFFLLIVASAFPGSAQFSNIDSLQGALKNPASSEKKVDILNQLAFVHYRISLEKSEQYATDAMDLASSIHYQKGLSDAYSNIGICESIQGDYTNGLEFFIKCLKIREAISDGQGCAKVLSNIAGVYLYQKDYDKAINFSEQSLKLQHLYNGPEGIGNTLVVMAEIYLGKKDTAASLRCYRHALEEFKKLPDRRHEIDVLIDIRLLEKIKDEEGILKSCFSAMKQAELRNDIAFELELTEIIAGVYHETGNNSAEYHYYHKALTLAKIYHGNYQTIKALLNLSNWFQDHHQYDSALLYYRDFADLRERTFSAEKANQIAVLEKIYETEKKDRLLDINTQQIRQQGLIISAISIILLILSISGFILYRYYRQKKKANIQLEQLLATITLQSQDLQTANLEIKRINENLEHEVSRRTQEIKIKNEKLIEYAYYNSHEVRGPLARIMGLVGLINRDLELEEIKDLNKKIEITAQELDLVIREINRNLEIK